MSVSSRKCSFSYTLLSSHIQLLGFIWKESIKMWPCVWGLDQKDMDLRNLLQVFFGRYYQVSKFPFYSWFAKLKKKNHTEIFQKNSASIEMTMIFLFLCLICCKTFLIICIFFYSSYKPYWSYFIILFRHSWI